MKSRTKRTKRKIYVDSDYRNPISTERVKAVVYAKDFDELRANSSASVKVKRYFYAR